MCLHPMRGLVSVKFVIHTLEPPLSHSHLPIRHLIRHLEKTRAVRLESAAAVTPVWIRSFVDQIANLFEPFSGVARVGYEFSQADDGWELAMFLGEREVVGGANDGRLSPINFNFNLQGIAACFTRLETMQWNAFPNSHVCFENTSDMSFVTVRGTVGDQPLRLQIHSTPPDCVGPGHREYSDGQIELV